MIRSRHLAAVLALALVTAAPAPAPPDLRAEARAWALWVHLPGQEVVEVATADAVLGAGPIAAAAPVAVAGDAPRGVRADADTPTASDELGSWLDPTASMSLQGAGMEARASANAASARVSAATGAGSGFALADELLTWEQQEQLLGAWGEANAALFEVANEVLAPLGPVLAPRQLRLPELEPMAPLGFVDVAGVEQMAARADTVTSPGFASATASSDAARIRLFGGFVELDDVRTSVVVEQTANGRVARPTVSIGRVLIAGLEVELSEEGLAVAYNDLLSRTALQPVLDDIVEQLATVGIRIDVAASRDLDGRLQASALQFEVATPDGMAVVSVGHAEAAVVPVVPVEPPAEPSTPTPTPAATTSHPGPAAGQVGSAPPPRAQVGPVPPEPPARVADPPLAAAEPAADPSTTGALRLAAPPPEAARALGLAYMVAAVGALAGLTTLLALVGARTPARRRPREQP